MEEGKIGKEETSKMQKELEALKEELRNQTYINDLLKNQVQTTNKDLANAKKEVKDSKYNDRFFQVERMKDKLVKNKKPMTLLFRLNHKENKVEVEINRSRHGTFIKVVLDILKIHLGYNEKKKDQIEISFNVSKIYFYNIIFFKLG